MSTKIKYGLTVLLLCSFGMLQAQFPKKLSAPKKPIIEYNRVEVKKVTMDKTEIEFVYTVDNPNSFGVDNVLADYELFLKGISTAVGKDMKFTIPGNSKSELRLPLEINYVNLFKSAEALTKAVIGGEKSIPFRIDILFKIDLKVAKFDIPISAEGELPLPDIKSAPDVKVKPKIKL